MTKREKYDGYEDYLKLNLAQRAAFEDAVAAMVNALKSAGVKWDRRSEEPMSDVDQITLDFCANGDFRLRDVAIWSYGGCGESLCFEPQPSEENEEIEKNE